MMPAMLETHLHAALHARIGQAGVDQRPQAPNVVAAGQLGHDPAVLGVHRDLAEQAMREQPAPGVVDRHTGFVAGRLDAQYAHRRAPPGQVALPGTRCVAGLACRNSHMPGIIRGSPTRRGIKRNPGDHMPSVKVRENEPFEFALRRFKRTCEKAGVLAETRKREFYEKPTQERKRKAAAAVKRHLRRVSRDATKRQRLY